MAVNSNLSLDFEPAGPKGEGGAAARVRVDSACSYSKDSGAPLITEDCGSSEEFEAEVDRLKEELDAILREGRVRFGAEPLPPAAPPVESAAEPSEPKKRTLSIREGLRVRDRMTQKVETLGPNDKIRVADELMKVGRFRHVVVLDDAGEVIGVLSQSDICLSAIAWAQGQGRSAHERTLETLPVKEVMQTAITTIGPDASLADAAQRMTEHKIGCLPVVEEGRLLGILTEGDFLALLTDSRLVSEGTAASD